MADVQVTSAELKDGTLTVTGSGFTQTTSVVEIDGNEVEFTVNDDRTEITVEDVPEGAQEVDVTKNGITSSATISGSTPSEPADQTTSQEGGSGEPYDPGADAHLGDYKIATPNKTPGDLVSDDLKTTSDASVADLSQGANVGAEAKNEARGREPKVEPLKPGDHLPGEDFRGRIQGTFAGDLNQDPREPYPTGNPPDPRETYHRIHGYYPDDETTDQPNEGAA